MDARINASLRVSVRLEPPPPDPADGWTHLSSDTGVNAVPTVWVKGQAVPPHPDGAVSQVDSDWDWRVAGPTPALSSPPLPGFRGGGPPHSSQCLCRPTPRKGQPLTCGPNHPLRTPSWRSGASPQSDYETTRAGGASPGPGRPRVRTSESPPPSGRTPLTQGHQPPCRGQHGARLLPNSQGPGLSGPPAAGLGLGRLGPLALVSGHLFTPLHHRAPAAACPRGSSVTNAPCRTQWEAADV